MALIDEEKLGSGIMVVLVTMLLAVPIVGMFASMFLGIRWLIVALTQTNSWLNVLYVVLGFVGYWVVLYLTFISGIKIGGQGMISLMVFPGIWSLFWTVFMMKRLGRV